MQKSVKETQALQPEFPNVLSLFQWSHIPGYLLVCFNLGSRRFHTCENQAKGDASLMLSFARHLQYSPQCPLTRPFYNPLLCFPLRRLTIPKQVSPSPFYKNYIEVIESNILGTALHPSRIDRRPAHSPPHCQGGTKT